MRCLIGLRGGCHMKIGDIGTTTSMEFFETLTWSLTSDLADDIIGDVMKDVDKDSVVNEALEGSMFLLKSMAIMYVINKQEAFIEAVFNKAWLMILVLLRLPAMKKVGRGARRTGSRLLKMLTFVTGTQEQRNKTAEIMSDQVGNIVSAQSNSQSALAVTRNSALRQEQISKEQLRLDFSEKMAQKVRDVMHLKLKTGLFTEVDAKLLKKMMHESGTNFEGSITEVTADQLAHIADYYFVKDSDGKIMGNTEAFFRLFNAVGSMKYTTG